MDRSLATARRQLNLLPQAIAENVFLIFPGSYIDSFNKMALAKSKAAELNCPRLLTSQLKFFLGGVSFHPKVMLIFSFRRAIGFSVRLRVVLSLYKDVCM